MSSIVQILFFLRCASRLFGVLQGVVRDREFIRLRGRAETLLTTVLALVERSVKRQSSSPLMCRKPAWM
jgi:hypothetical protein